MLASGLNPTTGPGLSHQEGAHDAGRLPLQQMPEVKQQLLSPALCQNMHGIMMPAREDLPIEATQPCQTSEDENWAINLLSRCLISRNHC